MNKITYFISWKSYLAQEYSGTKRGTVSYVAAQTRFGKKDQKGFLLFAIIIQIVKVLYSC